MYGGEEIGRHTDYVKSFMDESSEIPYSDDKAMAEYLLIQTIVNALSFPEEGRLKYPFSSEFSDDIKNLIVKTALEDTISIRKRYLKINKVLDDAGLELWILLDEFQQVVERWKPNDGYHFSSACDMLNENSKIKLVICGSDDLLKHMVLEDKSFWRERFEHKHRIPVGPINKEAFSTMVRDNKFFLQTGLSYSDLAIEALSSYTGGIALYGKEVCNHILKIVRKGDLGFNERSTIFVSDIAYVVQMLLNEQDSEKDVDISEGIRKIYDAVTKNLDSNSDMQYLKYIANWLKSHPESNSFPKSVFTRRILRDKNGLDNSLEIAKARMILKETKDELGVATQYDFGTLFYYYAFLGSTRPRLHDDLIFDLEAESVAEDEQLEDVELDQNPFVGLSNKTIIRYLREMDDDEQSGFAPVVVANVRTQAKEAVKELMGDTIFVSINAHTINTAFSTLLAPGASGQDLLNAFGSLPHLSTYLGKAETQEVKALAGRLTNASEDERVEIVEQIEAKTLPAHQRMIGDTLYAAIDSDDFQGVTEDDWEVLLGTKTDIDSLKNLPSEYLELLKFALMIHSVFKKIHEALPAEKQKELDYCPVAIMYCKLIETLLKRTHTPLYIKYLPDKTLKTGGGTFASLGTPERFNSRHRDLSIGSYSFHLVKAQVNIFNEYSSSFSFEPNADEDYEENIKLLMNGSEELSDVWHEHAQGLAFVHQIRNKSAHEAAPIPKKVFDLLIKKMFHEGELLRIWELSKST